MIEVEIDKNVYLPCYHHILDDDSFDIEFIWGGRDSGKSKFAAQYFTELSLTSEYFRCLLIKKTHESVKGSQWQMIKDNAETWGVDNLYKFPTSPLGIRCINKNTFATRGLDNAGNIRSFTNPSHAWIEEGNQITEEDLITIITGLRSDYGNVKLFFTFNPESDCPDYRQFWLYKMFFAKYEGQLNFTGKLVMNVSIKGVMTEVILNYRSTHTTYHDNEFVSPQRIAFHESFAISNPYFHRVFTQGLWGNPANDSPWAFAFNEQKHVSNPMLGRPHPVANRNWPLILSFDFNRNPFCCNVIQDYPNADGVDEIMVLEVIKLPKSGVDAMCAHILVYYPGFMYWVTGDYSGNAKTSLVQEEVTHYSLIQLYLDLPDACIMVEVNPKLEDNSTLVNMVLAFHKVTIHAEKAMPLIFDLQNVKRLADGSIKKANRTDVAQQADSLDGFRYFINRFKKDFQPLL